MPVSVSRNGAWESRSVHGLPQWQPMPWNGGPGPPSGSAARSPDACSPRYRSVGCEDKGVFQVSTQLLKNLRPADEYDHFATVTLEPWDLLFVARIRQLARELPPGK